MQFIWLLSFYQCDWFYVVGSLSVSVEEHRFIVSSIKKYKKAKTKPFYIKLNQVKDKSKRNKHELQKQDTKCAHNVILWRVYIIFIPQRLF